MVQRLSFVPLSWQSKINSFTELCTKTNRYRFACISLLRRKTYKGTALVLLSEEKYGKFKEAGCDKIKWQEFFKCGEGFNISNSLPPV